MRLLMLANPDNPMSTGLQAHQTQDEKRAGKLETAYVALKEELMTALVGNALDVVRCPGFHWDHMPAVDVVREMDAGDGGILERFIELASQAAQSSDHGLSLNAEALLKRIVHQHAEFHAPMVVAQDAS